MNTRRIALLAAAALAIGTTAAVAQRGPGGGAPRYDKTTETTIVGTIEEVQAHQGRAGTVGTHLIFRTEAGSVDIHVGPTNWLAARQYAFAKGDRLEVVGSKVNVGGTDAFLARTIRRGDATIVLRNQDGIPAWSRGAMRAR